MKLAIHVLSTLSLLVLLAQQGFPAEITVAGSWSVRVRLSPSEILNGQLATESVKLHVQRPESIEIEAERHDALPLFNNQAGGWRKGVRLYELRATETTTPYLLDRESLVVRSGDSPDSKVFEAGKDYTADLDWGTIGRVGGGEIAEGSPVYIDYRYTPQRIDAIVRTAAGRIIIRQGDARSFCPPLPILSERALLLGHVYIPRPLNKLEPKHLFPILEKVYPEPEKSSPTVAEQLLPKSLKKLKNGEPFRLLAWGDSVTDGSYLRSPEKGRWQEQSVARLKNRFPQANITLITEAWGGRNTASYLAEPPGSPHNYREKVLAAKPDLIISEFVNDAGLNPEQVEHRYSQLLGDFQSIGAEWIIFTPHYVRPDWMGLDREQKIDNDPRSYVAGLRQFGKKHRVAIAETSFRYGRLWRQGIPYTILLTNSINHPNSDGLRLYADALMELFP